MIEEGYKCCICNKPLGLKGTVQKMIKAGIVGYAKNGKTRYYHIACLDALCSGKKPTENQ